MAGVFQGKKFRYGLDMGGFWLRDKCRIIAVTLYLDNAEDQSSFPEARA